MELWDMIVAIVVIVFAAETLPKCLVHIGNIGKERREHRLEEMRIKAQMESQVLMGDSAVSANMTAELQSLREEISQLRGEVSQLASKVDSVHLR